MPGDRGTISKLAPLTRASTRSETLASPVTTLPRPGRASAAVSSPVASIARVTSKARLYSAVSGVSWATGTVCRVSRKAAARDCWTAGEATDSESVKASDVSPRPARSSNAAPVSLKASSAEATEARSSSAGVPDRERILDSDARPAGATGSISASAGASIAASGGGGRAWGGAASIMASGSGVATGVGSGAASS